MPKKSNWNYADAPESTSAANISKSYDHFINGKWTKPANGNYFPTTNPATGKKLSQVADGTTADINAAVKAARAAYNGPPTHPRTRPRICDY